MINESSATEYGIHSIQNSNTEYGNKIHGEANGVFKNKISLDGMCDQCRWRKHHNSCTSKRHSTKRISEYVLSVCLRVCVACRAHWQCEASRLELVVRGTLCACALSGGHVEIELAAQRVVPYARHLLEGLIFRRLPVRGRHAVVHDDKHVHNVEALRWQSSVLIEHFAERSNVPTNKL